MKIMTQVKLSQVSKLFLSLRYSEYGEYLGHRLPMKEFLLRNVKHRFELVPVLRDRDFGDNREHVYKRKNRLRYGGIYLVSLHKLYELWFSKTPQTFFIK